jgi:hypothetical protein
MGSVICPDCGHTRLTFREWGIYSDATPINEDGRIMAEHLRKGDGDRTGYDVICERCGRDVPFLLVSGRIVLKEAAPAQTGAHPAPPEG